MPFTAASAESRCLATTEAFEGYRGVGSDITERKLTETALRASSARFRVVVGALAEGVVLRDAEGKIIDCNASAERIFGKSLAQMKGLTLGGAGLGALARGRHAHARS